LVHPTETLIYKRLAILATAAVTAVVHATVSIIAIPTAAAIPCCCRIAIVAVARCCRRPHTLAVYDNIRYNCIAAAVTAAAATAAIKPS
jgi:hypothetical protein